MKFITAITLLLILTASSICAANESYSSSFGVDVDGDKKDDLFVYTLEKGLRDYKGNLTITSFAGDVLWQHDFTMTKNDFEDDLLVNEGNISAKDWVNHFFDGSLVYGGEFQQVKIASEDIDDGYLDFYSERLQVPSAELKNQIVSQSVNATFSYRASWREDFHMLVYLPELGKFISYSGGEYGE